MYWWPVINQDKSATIFCHQVAAWVPDMFCNFYFMKSHKIANNSATTEAQKNKRKYGILLFQEIFWRVFD